jgi:hypothetical protein
MAAKCYIANIAMRGGDEQHSGFAVQIPSAMRKIPSAMRKIPSALRRIP